MTTRQSQVPAPVQPRSGGSKRPPDATPPENGRDRPVEPALTYFAKRHRHAPAIAALLTFVVGLLNVLSAITPALRSRAREVGDLVPGELSHSAAALTLVLGVVLI